LLFRLSHREERRFAPIKLDASQVQEILRIDMDANAGEALLFLFVKESLETLVNVTPLAAKRRRALSHKPCMHCVL
jgi:hypothetical protein